MGHGVGVFANLNRKTVKAPVNPLDKSTIVSVYPREITESKWSLDPAVFTIPAAPRGKFSTTVVGPASWWKDVDPEQPLLEITNSSIQIAQSLIRDWMNGLFMCNMGDATPGLFYIEGAVSAPEILAKHNDKLELAKTKQKNWFLALVKAGDVLWSRTNGNPLAIDDLMRMAAQELEIKDKPWMRDFNTMELIHCKFCGSLVKPGFPVCSVCHHIVDERLYESLGGISRKAG